MATQTAPSLVPSGLSDSRSRRRLKIWPFLFVFTALLGTTSPAHAQWQQPFVFSNASGLSVFTRNDTTGGLTPVTGSPFPSKEPVDAIALDFKARFVFTASQSTNKVSMFTVDANTGAVQEVLTSPFAATTTNQPIFIATEITGQYLFAVNSIGQIPGDSSIDVFQIDPVNLALIPIQNVELSASAAVAAASDPRGHAFYVYVNSTDGFNAASVQSYSFNPATGSLELTSTGPGGNRAHSVVVDPQGTFLVAGHGELEGQLDSASISPADGTLSSGNTAILGANNFPLALVLDSNGKFLYSTIFNQVHLYSAPSFVESPNSPLPNFTTSSGWLADPTGPFIYFDKTYQVDAQTGLLSVAQPSNPAGTVAAFGRPPGQQPIGGPVAIFSPSSLSFGSLTIGQTTDTQVLHIISNGDQALSLNSVTITGNASDFPETDDCHAPIVLQPGKFCTAQVAFAPTAAGNRSASLTITDNASPNTLSALLTGTGVTPAPAVTLVPGSLDFGTQTEGTTSQMQTVTLTNSGTAPLQISGVSLGGANSNDFTMTSMCAGTIPTGGTCTISATFSPLAQGLRSATIGIADNAPNPTQTITISGNGSPAVTPTGTMTASVSAGQPANYPLTLNAGNGFSGMISLVCSGAPLGATCSVPSNVAVNTPFTVMVTTSGSHAILPYSNRPRFNPSNRWRLLCALALLLMALLAHTNRASQLGVKRLVWSGAFATMVFLMLISSEGCGGSGAAPIQQVVTPPGNYILTVAPSATNSANKPLQLSPIQLTLNVAP